MTELEFDPAKFTFSLPLFLCTRQSTSAAPFGNLLEGIGQAHGVFTDEDLAQRFIEANGLQSVAEIRVIPDAARLKWLLERWQSEGFTVILWDPSKENNFASGASIADLLLVLKRQGSLNMPDKTINVPLSDDGKGGLRVTGTRVQLERIVHAFQRGETPEQIVQDFDTLQLGSVYAVIAWYLQHKDEADAYLAQRAEKADDIRRKVRARQPDQGELRARLMARQAEKEKAHAAAAQ